MFNAQLTRVVEPRSPLVVTAGAYSALDAVGQKLQFSGVSIGRNGSGYIHGITIIDKAQVKAALKLFLFDNDFTAVVDNAVFTISDADAEKAIGVIASGSYEDFGSACSIYSAQLAMPIPFQAGGHSIYGQLRCTATPTYVATTDLIIRLHVSLVS